MKTIEEIYSELKTAFEAEAGITVNDGGDLALRFRAFAAQLALLFAQADFVERQCFPQTAVGEALDTHALQRGLSRRSAEKARGVLRFSIEGEAENDLLIAAGTRCVTAEEIEFTVTADSRILAGSSFCHAPAEAVLAGKSGNVPENTVVFMELPPTGVAACTNPTAFSGGCDAETDEGLRARVLDSFQNIPNSGNLAYYRNQALSVEGVAAVSLEPRKRGRGTLDITVAGANGVPEPALVGRVSHLMNSRREICVDVNVNAATAQSVNIDIELTAKDGYDFDSLAPEVESALRSFFTPKLLGKGVKLAQLGSLIFGIAGVDNYSINEPYYDIAADPVMLPVLNSLSISEV